MFGHTDLKKGVLIELEGAPYQVIDSSHIAMGRGGAVMRTKLKNLLTGAMVEKSFRSSDKLSPADIGRQSMQFLYKDGEDFAFMNQENFDQETLSGELVGDNANYLLEGNTVQLLKYGNRIIALEMPNSVYLKISQTGAGAKGDTANAALKPAILETGLEIMVPMFVKESDTIKVDTRTGQYLERQK